ncbi:MAG: AAA family ATPase [Nannocystis sp.]|nr:AAA family ATPase [Nannocystis sp.]
MTPIDPKAPSRRRVVLTGGPGGGKTTAADLFRREIGERVVIVPEAATLLFVGGFPRAPDSLARRAAQSAIYHVQRNLEDVQSARYPDRLLLCDRGTIDGAVYWPEDSERDFFAAQSTTLDRELIRYDAVLFFETAAAGRISIEGGNPARIEDLDQALELDRRLREVWSAHPRFVLVPHEASFFHKMRAALAALSAMLESFGP